MLYKILIVLATLIWGSSFVVVKDTTDVVSPAWILVVRFALAAFILALVYVRKRELYFRKDYIAFGALFGFLLFMGYYLQTIGITDTTPGKNAFLTGTYCVMVPFFAWAISRRRPPCIQYRRCGHVRWRHRSGEPRLGLFDELR